MSVPASRIKFKKQLSAALRPLAYVYALALLALCTVVMVSIRTDIPLHHFMSDPGRIEDYPPYIGLFSNLGVLLWCATATLLFFGSLLTLRFGAKDWASFLSISGVVTSVLLLDDFFMVHEKASEIHWRLSEEVVFAAYGLMLVAYLVRFRQRILTTQYLTLLLALGFMGLSLFVDILNGEAGGATAGMVLLEDGSKFLAIVSWLVYFMRLTADCVLRAARESKPSEV